MFKAIGGFLDWLFWTMLGLIAIGIAVGMVAAIAVATFRVLMEGSI